MAVSLGGATAAVQPTDATLEGRAILPAEATAPAPFPGVPNSDPAPAPGSTQPVGGFSALLEAPERYRHGRCRGRCDRERSCRGRCHGGTDRKREYWAMTDNGFGSKSNSRSFLLRVYRVRADLETARRGSGEVEIRDWITLRDPDERIPFEIVNEDTEERLLTGGDLDIESFRVTRRGDLWFGEEFGPFLVHTDSTGKVLEPPIPLPDVRSPDYPADYPAPFEGPANLGRSNGFEGMALTKDGRRLYPTLEGPVAGDRPTVRRMYEFDLRTRSYTSTRRTYEVATADLLVADLTALDRHRLVALERDNGQGAAAAHKRAFVVDLRVSSADGTLAKRPVVDLLDLDDPALISLPARPGDIGLGDPFSMPYVTIESVLPLRGSRLAIANDTNFGSTGRNPDLPDYSDFVVVRVPDLR